MTVEARLYRMLEEQAARIAALEQALAESKPARWRSGGDLAELRARVEALERMAAQGPLTPDEMAQALEEAE